MSGDTGDPLIEVLPPPPPRRLSTDLRELLAVADGRTLTLGELEAILQGRGVALFLLLLSIPFVFPLPIPGLSTPFGIVILLMGIRIACGRKPSLPVFILRRTVKYSSLEKIVNLGLKLCAKMEKVVKPRMHFLQRWPGMINLIGVGIALAGLLLCLPLPIPLSNSIPALAVIFLTAGMIERDGLLVLLGYVAALVAWVYVFFMFAAIGDGVRNLTRHFGF
jgi:hypothetical protein